VRPFTFQFAEGAGHLLQKRLRVVAAFHAAWHGAAAAPLGDGPAELPSDSAEEQAYFSVLDRLWGENNLVIDRLADGEAEVWLIPGDDQVAATASGDEEAFLESSIVKRHAKLVRSSPGAIFRFPLEAGDEAIEVFITDWSPCPAACALAVHQGHPAGRGRTGEAATAFTGRFARHPLTGDLLPVWVADWVKPSFGTGAVLVNPAHDAVDLAFARRVGLPIRFALTPSSSDRPEDWPTPPVVKQGVATRTGPYDGLSVAEATERYFAVLAERGLAKRHVDRKLPILRLGRIRRGDGRWRYDAARGRLTPADAAERHAGEATAPIAVHFEPAAPLKAAAATGADSALTLLVARTAVDSELLAYRLLRHATGRQSAGGAVRVVIVNEVELGKGQREEPDALALLAAADPSEVAVVRPQVVEQIRAFETRHAELAERPVAEPGNPGERIIAGLLEGLKTGSAFSALYKWQRDLFRESASTPAPYRTMAERLLTAARTADRAG
jgi:leucyl-tRNA synthetase